MNSLYDVFCAIKADEADHVSTMTECLDPTVAVRSPSIEKRILTGLALAAAASVIVSATGTFVPTDVAVDGTAVESLASGSAGLFEAISAGAAALTAQIMAGASQGVVSETAYSAADVLVANSVVDSVDGVLDSVEAAGVSEGGTMFDMILVGLAAATKEAATTEGEAKILGSDIDIVLELFGRAIMDAIYTVARFLAVLLMAL
jgi:urease gamma subunit